MMSEAAEQWLVLAGELKGRAVRAVTARLKTAGVGMPALEAELLVCEAAGIRSNERWRDDIPLCANAVQRLQEFMVRRLSHEPVSRIIGHAEFHGLNLLIDSSVLDPRGDTEVLVDVVLKSARDPLHPWRILDLGTGSGAILCALLSQRPNAFGVGVDRSVAAAAVARTNLMRHKMNDRAVIIVGHWASAIEGSGRPFDVVVANPPYIENGAIPGLDPEVRDFDPRLALDGGIDGLQAYHQIVASLPRLLCEGGLAAFEIGFGQGAEVSRLCASVGLGAIQVTRDLAGHERVVSGRVRNLLGVDVETV